MDNVTKTKNTTAFYVQAVVSFAVALIAVIFGIASLPVDHWTRGFLAIGSLFLVTTTFTLAKVVRDAQESTSITTRLDALRMERLMAEFNPYGGPTGVPTSVPMTGTGPGVGVNAG